MRVPKPGELTDKDMSVIREGASAKEQHASNFQMLKDYSLQHRVKVSWGMSEDSERDRMFKLQVDDKTVILDAEEVLRSLRWI